MAECPTYVGCAKESDESVAVAVISRKLIEKVREEMPVFEHRRSDIYSLQEVKPVIINSRENYMFADKVIPSSIVFYETGMSYAFTNIRCVVPGRILKSYWFLFISSCYCFFLTCIRCFGVDASTSA